MSFNNNVNPNDLFNTFFGTQSRPTSSSSSTSSANSELDDLLSDLFANQAKFHSAATSRAFNTGSSFKATPQMKMSMAEELRNSQSFENYSEKLIAGFLNLNEEDGWKLAGDPAAAEMFIRHCILKHYEKLSKDEKKPETEFAMKILRNAFQGLPSKLNEFNQIKTELDPCSPQFTRVIQDINVQGWNNHKVGRLVGNLGSTYSPTKPFFEVIVNSDTIHPFKVSVHPNEEALNARRKILLGMKKTPREIALPIYFSSTLDKPQEFLTKHEKQLGPNSKRMIQGLCYLETVEMREQRTGNCWMKQPLRNFLAALYLEIISANDKITPENAWKEAKQLYKDVQKHGLSIVEKLLSKLPNSDLKVLLAWKAVEKRREDLK